MHVVGSDNDLAPWDELAGGDRPRLRLTEFASRRAANLDWINAAFDRARSDGSAGVLLMMQAEPADARGFGVERALILQRAADFARPVLLVHGVCVQLGAADPEVDRPAQRLRRRGSGPEFSQVRRKPSLARP